MKQLWFEGEQEEEEEMEEEVNRWKIVAVLQEEGQMKVLEDDRKEHQVLANHEEKEEGEGKEWDMLVPPTFHIPSHLQSQSHSTKEEERKMPFFCKLQLNN